MKVKIICKDNYWELEKSANDFLCNVDRLGKKVMDIKFSGEGSHSGYLTGRWSVMIIIE